MLIKIKPRPAPARRVSVRPSTRLRLPPRASTTLHSVTHSAGTSRQAWCGPAAISAITGKTAEVAAAILNVELGRPQGTVTGTEILEVSRTLNRLGYSLAPSYVTQGAYGSAVTADPSIMVGPSLSLNQWLDASHRNADQVYLADVTHDGTPHWIAVKGDRLVDSMDNGGTNARTQQATIIVRRAWVVRLLENSRAAAARRVA